MKLVLTSALLGALFLISGCATQCEGVCAQYNSCNFPVDRTVAVDCANFCGTVDSFNQRAAAAGTADDCDALWKAHLTCWQGQSANICDSAFEGCDDTAFAWEACVDGYCADVLAADPPVYDPQCDRDDIYSGTDLLIFSPFISGL